MGARNVNKKKELIADTSHGGMHIYEDTVQLDSIFDREIVGRVTRQTMAVLFVKRKE